MLKIEYVPLAKLQPYSANARSHPKRQIAQIVASIKAYGFCNPILVDKLFNIVAGHGRLIAEREMGLETVPVVVLGELTELQARALRLADNKIALNSAWDTDLLKIELGELSTLEIDLDMTGFTAGEINVILDERDDPDDNTLPTTVTPRVSAGEVWALGEHRIGCGDVRELAFLQQVVGDGERVDAAFLDPPYDVKIKGHANLKSTHREFAMASGEMGSERFIEFLRLTLGHCAAVSKDGAVHFVCMDWRHQPELWEASRAVYSVQLNLCVWNKSNAGMGSLFRSKHELVSVLKVGKAPHLNTVELGEHGRSRTNVWDYPSVNTFNANRRGDINFHPTVKPIGLVADAIQDVTRRGETVLDGFLGSGTTLLACERTGRRCRGVEIDPAYVDITIDRWVAMTGRLPHRISAPEAEAADVGWAL